MEPQHKYSPARNVGALVTTSSNYSADHQNHALNAVSRTGRSAWSAGVNDANQWLQFSFESPKLVKSVDIQGRIELNQRVTEFMVKYSLNGIEWFDADNGRVFAGNKDALSIVSHDFTESLYARTIRIVPTAWEVHISMRAEIYVDVEAQGKIVSKVPEVNLTSPTRGAPEVLLYFDTQFKDTHFSIDFENGLVKNSRWPVKVFSCSRNKITLSYHGEQLRTWDITHDLKTIYESTNGSPTKTLTLVDHTTFV